jgi:hypothetical protein
VPAGFETLIPDAVHMQFPLTHAADIAGVVETPDGPYYSGYEADNDVSSGDGAGGYHVQVLHGGGEEITGVLVIAQVEVRFICPNGSLWLQFING